MLPWSEGSKGGSTECANVGNPVCRPAAGGSTLVCLS